MSHYKYEKLGLLFGYRPNSVDNWSGATRESIITASLVMIGEITLRPHAREPEYCLLSEEQNPFRKKKVL